MSIVAAVLALFALLGPLSILFAVLWFKRMGFLREVR